MSQKGMSYPGTLGMFVRWCGKRFQLLQRIGIEEEMITLSDAHCLYYSALREKLGYKKLKHVRTRLLTYKVT